MPSSSQSGSRHLRPRVPSPWSAYRKGMGSDMSTTPDHFPTDVAGLPEARPPELVELSDGDRVRPADRSGRQAARRHHRADAGLQRLDPRADAEGAGRLGDRRPRREPGRHGGHGPLARAAAREPLRRHARDAGADPGRRSLLGPRHVPRPRRLLVPPAHPRGLRPGDGAVRQRPGRARRPRLLAPGTPRGAPHARRHPARGRQGRAVQPRRDDALGDGPVRRRAAGERRDGSLTDRASSARSSAST